MPKKFSAHGVIFVFAGIFLLRNLLTPIFADDYAYSFIWESTDEGNNLRLKLGDIQRVESFSDILYSQWQHYFTWGGRTIAHTLVQFFCWHNKLLFDFANVICFITLALEIYIIATGRISKSLDVRILIWIFFSLWFCLPDFFQTTLWITGACNYLWMAALQFGFLVPYTLKFWQTNFPQKTTHSKIIFMAILGLMAGWSNEAGGAVILLLTFLFLIYFRRQKTFESWMAVGLLGLVIGYALLIFAPGNFNRMALDPYVANTFTPQLLAENFSGLIHTLMYDSILFLPILGYFLYGKKTPKVLLCILIFSVAGILVPCILMLSPSFPVRAAFISPIFLIIASITALEKFSLKFPKKLIQILKIFWAVTIIYSLAVDWSIHSQIAARYEYIEQHKNDALITVEPLNLPEFTNKIFWAWAMNRFTVYVGDLKPYLDFPANHNLVYAKYYGLRAIIVDESQWFEVIK